MEEISKLINEDLSILIILLGASLLYFGKVISDTKVERYDKLGYYIEGLFFTSIYIFVPFLFAYYVKDLFKISAGVLLFFQIVIIGCLSWNILTHEYLRRHGLLSEVKKKVKEKIDLLTKTSSIKGKLFRIYEKNYKKKISMDTEEFIMIFFKIPIKIFGNKYILFLFAFLTILSNFIIFEYDVFLFSGISAVLSFFILTMIALAYGYRNAYYPPAKIFLTNGEIIEGKILKFGDFIYVLKGDKKLFINKDKIDYIEESLYEEKGANF